LRELSDAGVDSIKIEGRIKKFHYVYTVVDAWRKQLGDFYNHNEVSTDNSALHKVFNRDFSNAFLKGNISADMFIDNPRDNSAIHLSELEGISSDEKLEKAKGDVYDERTEIITSVEDKINRLSCAKAPLILSISGQCGTPLKLSAKTPETSFEVFSEINLSESGKEALNREILLKRLKALNDTEYFIQNLDLENLQSEVYLPFKELTSIKRKLLFRLNNSREFIDPIDVPVLTKQSGVKSNPTLSVLISSQEDLRLCNETAATVYFQLPDSFKNEIDHFVDLFRKNEKLIPWFPSVLLGDDYSAAVEFLEQLQPKTIVTDNTGIAYEAYKKGIPWIAGPSLNSVNSFSLLCLKENFNCLGAFISNEVSKAQIKGIKKPENFELYFSMYHPIGLMTSRQCLFPQVTVC